MYKLDDLKDLTRLVRTPVPVVFNKSIHKNWFTSKTLLQLSDTIDLVRYIRLRDKFKVELLGPN